MSEVPPLCQACPSPSQPTDCPVRSVSPQCHHHLLSTDSSAPRVTEASPAFPSCPSKGRGAGGAAQVFQHTACCTELAAQGTAAALTAGLLLGGQGQKNPWESLPGQERRSREKPGGEGIAEHLGQQAEKDLSNSPGRVWRRLQQKGDRGTSEMYP